MKVFLYIFAVYMMRSGLFPMGYIGQGNITRKSAGLENYPLSDETVN